MDDGALSSLDSCLDISSLDGSSPYHHGLSSGSNLFRFVTFPRSNHSEILVSFPSISPTSIPVPRPQSIHTHTRMGSSTSKAARKLPKAPPAWAGARTPSKATYPEGVLPLGADKVQPPSRGPSGDRTKSPGGPLDYGLLRPSGAGTEHQTGRKNVHASEEKDDSKRIPRLLLWTDGESFTRYVSSYHERRRRPRLFGQLEQIRPSGGSKTRHTIREGESSRGRSL